MTQPTPRETPSERSTHARLAAHHKWAGVSNRSDETAPARRAFRDRFERQVDPKGVLPEAERLQRADSARRAWYTELALRSAKARRARKSAAVRPVPVQAEPHPEAVRAPRRGRAAKADPFAVMQTDESRMADRIDEAFGDAS